MSDQSAPRSLAATLGGRSFVNPLFDYMLIGGGLSLVFTVVIAKYSRDGRPIDESLIPYFLLLCTFSHFAASTVRLYTKPGAYQSLPFLTMGFPLITIFAVTLSMVFAEDVGPHMQSLMLTWSPYHYAAQVYGLAVMYCYRSGCAIAPRDKKLLWWTSMLPFFFAFLTTDTAGLDWLIGKRQIDAASPEFFSFLRGLVEVLKYATFFAPLLLFAKMWRSKSGPMPLISLLVVMTNGVWWITLNALQAFIWATIFHGIQYMAIVVIFHVRDQMSVAGNRHSRFYHVIAFYAMCVLLGYILFRIIPEAYRFAGFNPVESALLVIAAINVHHFIVDAYIWRLKKTDSNRTIVDAGDVPVSGAAEASATQVA